MSSRHIEYSHKYNDDVYEYRHVQLPREILKKFPQGILLQKFSSKYK